MTTQPSEFQPRDHKGRFGTVQVPEATGVSLVSIPGGLTETLAPGTREWKQRVSDRAQAAHETAHSMVSYVTADGGFTDAERQDDVEEALREQFGSVDETTFDRHFGDLAKHAENASALERCYAEIEDTDAWDDLAVEYGIEEDDFYLDSDGGQPNYDLTAMHAATVEAVGDRMYEALYALADADEKARRG